MAHLPAFRPTGLALVERLAAVPFHAQAPDVLAELGNTTGVAPMDLLIAAATPTGVDQIAYTIGLRDGERTAQAWSQVPPVPRDLVQMRALYASLSQRATEQATPFAQRAHAMHASGFWQGLATMVARLHYPDDYRNARDAAGEPTPEAMAALQAQVQQFWKSAGLSSVAASQLLLTSAELRLLRERSTQQRRRSWERRYADAVAQGVAPAQAVRALAAALVTTLGDAAETEPGQMDAFVAAHERYLLKGLDEFVPAHSAPAAPTATEAPVQAPSQAPAAEPNALDRLKQRLMGRFRPQAGDEQQHMGGEDPSQGGGGRGR